MTQDSTIEKIIHILSELQSQLNEIPLSKVADVNSNEHPSETAIQEKRSSWWSRVRQVFKKINKVKNENSNDGSESGGSQGRSRNRRAIAEDQVEADLVIRKLRSDIRQMIDAFSNLTHFQTDMSKSLEADLRSKKLKAILEKTDSIKSRSYDLKEIRKKIFFLRCQIPSLLYKQSSKGLSITGSQTAEENDTIDETGSDLYLPSLHISKDFKSSEAFEEVVEKFQYLEFTQKLCLLSFAVFPENREVKRTMLMYWWIGEGFLGYESSEDSVTRILDELSAKGLLEPVEDERKLKPNSYKMEPHVHSAVIYLAQLVDLYKLCNWKGKPLMANSKYHKVCLVKGSSSQQVPKFSEMNLKNLNTVFNSTERYPDFTFKWFSELESLRVLYLGRWERTAKRHIEVESTKFLNNMKALKNLRLASFQGISRIEKLENPICALPKLVILDLRACYNLEELPKDIGSLKSLIYLDVSECYMLDRMPKGIAELSRLQVLKGFVISESDDERRCAVENLLQLRKLSITVNKYLFKVEYLMESLKNLHQLESLKIAWGARFPEDTKGEKSKETNEAGRKKETTNVDANVEEENQRGPAIAKDLKEQDNDQVLEKKGDAKEKGRPQMGSEDAVDSKKEEGKKRDMVKAASLKADMAAEGDKKASPTQELTDTIQNKSDDYKGKTKVEGDGDKGKVNLQAGKNDDETKPESSKSDNAVKEDMNASLPQESTDKIPDKPDDKSKVENKGDENKEKVNPDDKLVGESSKSNEVNDADMKANISQEPTNVIQNKQGDQKGENKVEKEEDGDKGKSDPEEEKKPDEIEAESSKSDNGIKGDKKASPLRESKDANPNKPDDQKDKSKVEKEEDGDKGSTEEGKKQTEAESLKSDNGVEGDKKTGPLQETTDAIKNNPDDKNGKSEGEKEGDGDGDKDKVNTKEGKKRDEVEAENSKSDNGIKGDKKASPLQESTEEIQSKQDENQIGGKQEEKGDGEKAEADLQEQSSKPDKVIEGDKKTNPPQESKDIIQSKTNDFKDNSKVQEKGAGEKTRDDLEVAKKREEGEAKTQKPDKKYGKKVSFSEESIAQTQKKQDDLKGDNAMTKEIQEKASSSKPEKTAHKETRSRKAVLSMVKRSQTKMWGTGWHDNPATDNPKLPSSLKKLELECFPEKEPPIWLNPENLDNLKKLSIKGGKLSRISNEPPTAENNCDVQILRLKYLIDFKAEWKDLQTLFPQMKLLEKYKCPKIAFCPTDGNGVWRLQSHASPYTTE